MNKYIKVTQNARIFMVTDTADVDNWKGKTMQLYVWEVPEQLLNKLKFEMACWNGCEKSICDMIVLSVQRSEFLFFSQLNFSHVILLYLSNYRLIYPSWSRASWAEHQTEFSANRGGKLFIKFGGSQGTQDVKTASSCWQNNNCFAFS